MSIALEFKTTKNLIMAVMTDYPETRNSDTLLYLKCCSILGAITIEDAEKLDLSIISVHKMRQYIQNRDGLLLPSKEVQEVRKKRAEDARNFMRGYENLELF